MALQPFYGSPEDVPEALREHYDTDDTGRARLVVESQDGWALEDVKGLKSALGKLKDQQSKATGSLEKWTALERDPDEIRDALEELENLKSSTDSKQESQRITQLQTELEKTRQSARREREKEIAPMQEKITARTEQLKQVMIDNQLRDAITSAGGSVPLLLRALKDEVKAVETDSGGIEVQIVDADGPPRVTGADLRPMSFTELGAEKKSDDQVAPACDANSHSGGGTRPSQSTGQGSLTAESIGNMSMAEYIRARESRQIA